MNKEIVKAMNKKEKKHTFKKWWNKNGYKVMRVILFPIWIIIVINQKIEIALDKCNKWDEERANEILSYYVPRVAQWDNEDKDFYLFDNGYGWTQYRKRIKLKDRRFWKNHASYTGYKVRDYLINHFELEGFTKEVRNCDGGWTELLFKMN